MTSSSDRMADIVEYCPSCHGNGWVLALPPRTLPPDALTQIHRATVTSCWRCAIDRPPAADTIDRQREEIGRLRELLFDTLDPRALGLAGETYYFRDTEYSRNIIKRFRSALSDTTRERSEDAPTPTGDS